MNAVSETLQGPMDARNGSLFRSKEELLINRRGWPPSQQKRVLVPSSVSRRLLRFVSVCDDVCEKLVCLSTLPSFLLGKNQSFP